MNISYYWLKDLIDIDISAEELAEKLTRVGLAVDAVHPQGDDFVLDLDLTSNRPDCLSHLGVAREVAVIANSTFHIPHSKLPTNLESGIRNSEFVTIPDPDLCNRFTARIIRGVKVGPSPLWLVDRLEAVGERSINNVADITNYVMLELGQPMHSFDLDKLAENRIVVRRAKNGEKITTLDEVDRVLDDSMLAICDAEKPVAVGGVMGGLASSITDSTVNVLLEVAYFNRGNIRATSRKLNLNTEASYRFERGVDIEQLVRASDRASALICELAGGQPAEFVDVYPVKAETVQVGSPDLPTAVTRLTGLKVEKEECIRILDALGMTSESNGTTFASPTWRHDIAIEEDLVEEVARHAGYENVESFLPPAFGAGEHQPAEGRKRRLRTALADLGFDEAISYSFIDIETDGVFEPIGDIPTGIEDPYITLTDAVIEGAVRMRPSILPGLLDAVRHNFNFQRRDLKLFETGHIFTATGGEEILPTETEALSMVITGGESLQDKALPGRDLDFYDLKGALEAALDAAGVSGVTFVAAAATHLRSGQAAHCLVSGKRVGTLGRLHDDIAARYKFRQPVYVAEIDLGSALLQKQDSVAYQPLARYPGVIRDVSLLAKRDLTFGAIRTTIRDLHFDLCTDIAFVDVYEGKGLADDERSITIRLEYRSPERTLVEDEVNAVHKQILDALEQKLPVTQRV